MSLLRVIFSWGLIAAIGLGAVPATAAAQPSRTAIVGADVLPMTGPERLKSQTILVEGDRIVRIGPSRTLPVPSGYQVIDARGMWVMPGLVDMHVHLAPEPGRPGDAAQRAMAVMLGHGVTTARGMAGSPANLLVRDLVERGDLIGPRLYAAAPAVHFKSAPGPNEARAAVRSAKEAGFDLVKSHHLVDIPTWQAVQDEARRVGLGTAGHVTNEIGLSRALASGQQVEHLDGAFFELLAAGSPERNIDFAQIPPPSVIEAVAKTSDGALQTLARRVAASRSYQVPTLSLFEQVVALDRPDAELMRDPDMRFVPDAALQQWAAQRDQLRQSGLTAKQARLFKDIRQRLVRAYAKAGVPLMAGSDTAQAFHIWGPGLVKEIEALAAAGLTPMQALKSATLVPRDYFRSLPKNGSSLGWKADFGTVEEGARSDLILLREDPSKDLAALRRIDTVIAAGKVYDRRALDLMLERAAADAKTVKKTSSAPAQARQVFVMRHLETPAGAGSDPGLTPEGSAQAARLAGLLRNKGITAIYVTATRRSVETATPLAKALGLTPAVYDPRQPGNLVESASGSQGNLLIVAQSNTVPDLVARFAGTAPPPLGERDFGTVWQVDAASRATSRFRVEENGNSAPAQATDGKGR